jgi:hypothetical protein
MSTPLADSMYPGRAKPVSETASLTCKSSVFGRTNSRPDLRHSMLKMVRIRKSIYRHNTRLLSLPFTSTNGSTSHTALTFPQSSHLPRSDLSCCSSISVDLCFESLYVRKHSPTTYVPLSHPHSDPFASLRKSIEDIGAWYKQKTEVLLRFR